MRDSVLIDTVRGFLDATYSQHGLAAPQFSNAAIAEALGGKKPAKRGTKPRPVQKAGGAGAASGVTFQDADEIAEAFGQALEGRR